MKKLLTVVLILFFLPIVIAVDAEVKEEFNQGETFLLKLYGNFYEPVSVEDVKFYRDQVQNVRTEVTTQIVEIDDDFYIYGQLLGKSPGNYSVVIENVRYLQFNEIIEEDVVLNFTINEEFADFSINPAAIYSEDDFSIEVLNLVNNQITIDVEIESNDYITSVESVSLNSGDEEEIEFFLEVNPEDSINYITLETENTEYIIPVYISSFQDSGDSESENENDNENENSGSLRFDPSLIDVSISTNSETEGIIYLKNNGNIDIDDVSLFVSDSLEPYVSLSDYEFNEIDSDSEEKIFVYFESGSEPREIEGRIIASSDDYSASIDVYLNFDLGFQGPNNEEENDVKVEVDFSRTCSQLNGNLCSSENQVCSGETVYTIDGACCTGMCENVEQSYTGKIIGWLIILSLIGGALWFYFKKYKGQGKPKDLFNLKRR